MDAWVLWLVLILGIAVISSAAIVTSYNRRGIAWRARVRTERKARVWRVRRLQEQGKAPPSVSLQVDKAHHYLQTPGGRRRTKNHGKVGE